MTILKYSGRKKPISHSIVSKRKWVRSHEHTDARVEQQRNHQQREPNQGASAYTWKRRDNSTSNCTSVPLNTSKMQAGCKEGAKSDSVVSRRFQRKSYSWKREDTDCRAQIVSSFSKLEKHGDDDHCNRSSNYKNNNIGERAVRDANKDLAASAIHCSTKKSFVPSTADTFVTVGMKKVGPNKLILTRAESRKRKLGAAPAAAKDHTMEWRQRSAAHVRKRNKNPNYQSPRRIKVHVPTEESPVHLSVKDGETGKSAPPNQVLTDFAYRQLGGRTKTGQNANRVKASSAHAIVRVKPDASKTPICTTFLRGLVCMDECCMKRHDIPREFAVPVCSFFQKKGMCLKENCPFRHVKINPKAILCPSFSVLGFCEDEKCPMMHKRPKRSATQWVAEQKVSETTK